MKLGVFILFLYYQTPFESLERLLREDIQKVLALFFCIYDEQLAVSSFSTFLFPCSDMGRSS